MEVVSGKYSWFQLVCGPVGVGWIGELQVIENVISVI